MQYKEIGNIKVPVLGLGTWEIGGRIEADNSLTGYWVEFIKSAIEMGFTHIDTSEAYGSGLTEKIIGKAIKSFDRKKIFITSKLWVEHLNYHDAIKSLNGSLERLDTDYVDLYLVHKPTMEMDLKGTMEAFEHLRGKGMIKFIGLGNFSKKQVAEAQSFLRKSTISALQNEYNLLNRDIGALELCETHKMLFIANRPLLRGKLAKPGIKVLDLLAKKYKKSQAQIALNWLISKNITAIPKASTREHLADNIGSVGWSMDVNDYRKLDCMKHEIQQH